ncbi:MAG: hypothetical protein ACYDBS_04945 [Acidimicrobiales bacterium]
MVEAASEVPATAAWILRPAAMQLWEWFMAFIKSRPTDPDLRVGAIRAGAANLLAGSVSVATKVVVDLRGVLTWAPEAPKLLAESKARPQQFASDYGGGYLGGNPDAAIEDFLDFAASVEANVL